MTHQSAATTIDRINTATPNSPIAVFSTSKSTIFDTMFANTALTLRRIKKGDDTLIGVFYKTHYLNENLHKILTKKIKT